MRYLVTAIVFVVSSILVVIKLYHQEIELDELLYKSLSYEISDEYIVVDHTKRVIFMSATGKGVGQYVIRIGKDDHRDLMDIAKTSGVWKYQPPTKGSVVGNRMSWEKITEISDFGLIAIAKLDSSSNEITIHYYRNTN